MFAFHGAMRMTSFMASLPCAHIKEITSKAFAIIDCLGLFCPFPLVFVQRSSLAMSAKLNPMVNELGHMRETNHKYRATTTLPTFAPPALCPRAITLSRGSRLSNASKDAAAIVNPNAETAAPTVREAYIHISLFVRLSICVFQFPCLIKYVSQFRYASLFSLILCLFLARKRRLLLPMAAAARARRCSTHINATVALPTTSHKQSRRRCEHAVSICFL